MQKNMKIYLLFAFILIGLNSQDSEQEEIQYPAKKILRSAESITDIKVQFCQAWSSAGYFNHMKEQLESKYSDVRVIPEQYPLKNPRLTIYYIMIGIEILIMIIIIISGYIKPQLEKLVGPDVFNLINENKLVKIGFVYVFRLYIGQIISNTGAFEVFCNDKLIWSTIDNNGIKPTLKTIVQMIKKMR